MTQLKKLSVATVFGKIDVRAVLASTVPIRIMRAIGQAVALKSGNSPYGDWTALMGQFKCTNLSTGEQFEGAALFLPDVALTPIRVAMTMNDARGVSFAIDLAVRESANRKPGGSVYEYTFESVLAPSDNDPIAQIEARIEEEAQKALPGPDGAETEEQRAEKVNARAPGPVQRVARRK